VLLEDDAVVNSVEAAAGGDKVLPRRAFVAESVHDALGFDAFVFEKAEKDEAVKDALGQFGERFAIEARVLVLESAGQSGAVFVELLEERFVYALVAAGEQTVLDGFAARLGRLRWLETGTAVRASLAKSASWLRFFGRAKTALLVV
jgi:hypothetical protein